MHCESCGKWTMEVYARVMDNGIVMLICLDCYEESERLKKTIHTGLNKNENGKEGFKS